MHIKLISPGAQDFKDSPAAIIPISSRGLVGSDESNFTKRAGASAVEILRKLDLKPGEIPVHMFAIGATEFYGPNRNGDGFKEAACRDHCHTFVKYARWYRNHKNKDTKKSYGVVKAAFFNDTMKRLELIAALNGTAEAAQANGGLVADQELEKLASQTDDWGVSMAAKVPEDVCSSCGNRARTREEYCDENTCERGGLKRNITKVARDGHILHADNPEPLFFDISDVWRPADRIAYVTSLVKTANASSTIDGSTLARLEKVSIPESLYGVGFAPEVAKLLKTASVLSEIEQHLQSDQSRVPLLATLVDWRNTSPVGHYKSSSSARSRFLELQELANSHCVLPVNEFLAQQSGLPLEKISHLVSRVNAYLPGIYSHLLQDSLAEEKVANSIFSDTFQTTRSRSGLPFIEKYAVDLRNRSSRALSVSRRPSVNFERRSKSDSEAEQLAEHYAFYKLAVCTHWMDTIQDHAELFACMKLAVVQNYLVA